MNKKPIRPKRCKECRKILCQSNESGLCNYHNTRKLEKIRRLKTCWICKEKCTGNYKIITKKGTEHPFCKRHFNMLLDPAFSKPSTLRQEIKRLQSYH
jgi:hypothetical protein